MSVEGRIAEMGLQQGRTTRRDCRVIGKCSENIVALLCCECYSKHSEAISDCVELQIRVKMRIDDTKFTFAIVYEFLNVF